MTISPAKAWRIATWTGLLIADLVLAGGVAMKYQTARWQQTIQTSCAMTVLDYLRREQGRLVDGRVRGEHSLVAEGTRYHVEFTADGFYNHHPEFRLVIGSEMNGDVENAVYANATGPTPDGYTLLGIDPERLCEQVSSALNGESS